MIYINLGEQGVYAQNDHALSGHLVENGETTIVLDMGNGSLNKLLSVRKLTDVKAVVLSHLHFDHICDVFIMDYALSRAGHRVDLYMPRTPSDVNAMVRKTASFNIREYDENDVLSIGRMTLRFTPMTHPVETYAVRCDCGDRSLFYTGDTNYNERIAQAAAGADLMIADAALLHAELSPRAPHLSARQAASVARTAGVKKLVLSHKIPTTPDSRYLAESIPIFPETETASEGKIIEL